MLIIMLNKPKVRKISGKENIWIIGFMRAFRKPIIAPARRRLVKSPEKWNPGIYLLAMKMAKELAKIRIRMPIELVLA